MWKSYVKTIPLRLETAVTSYQTLEEIPWQLGLTIKKMTHFHKAWKKLRKLVEKILRVFVWITKTYSSHISGH